MKLIFLIKCLRRVALLIILFLIVIYSSAQQVKQVLPLPEAMAQVKTGIALNDVTSNRMFELIDLTGDSLVLGYLPTPNGDNNRQAIVTPLAKGYWLNASIAEGAAKSFLGRSNPILYILNDLSVGRTNMGNYVRLKATVYEAGPSGYYLLNKVDHFMTDNEASINSVSNLINTSISGTAAKVNSGILQNQTGKGLTREEVIKLEEEKYAFISRALFTTGVYMNYEEFKQDTPSYSQFYLDIDTLAKTTQINASVPNDNTRRLLTPWAIVAGGELYVYKNGKLYAAEAVGNNLVLSKYIDPYTRKNNAFWWRNNVGKRFSNWQDANPFDNRYAIKIDNYRSKGVGGEAIKINADNGDIEL